MEQPDIHFTTTSDGVTIAYWSIGEGPPLILTHHFALSHAEMEWTVPSMASFYRAVAQDHRLIRFDPRHSGMSSTGADIDTTLQGMGSDISAVADACGVDAFALFAVATMGPVAIEYAAAHSERVSHLILCNTYPTSKGGPHAGWIGAQSALARTEGATLAATLFREIAPPDEADEVVALASAAGGPDLAGTANSALGWDAADRLEEVEAPTLVLASRDSRLATLDDTRALATRIPNAQLKSVGGHLVPYYSDQAVVIGAVGALLGTNPQPKISPGPRGITTIVFTDLVASTELMNRLGDAEGREAFRWVEETTAGLATDHHGELVKYTGDGSLLAFPSTSGALAFAVALIGAIAESPMDLRVGIAAGEPLREHGDLHGAVVHQAARIADQGTAGEIVVSDSVRQLALGKGFAFEPAGETTLKGFDEPVALWRVDTSR